MKRKRIGIFLLILVVAVALCGCKSSDYNKAASLFKAGDYDAAAEAFSALGDYKDSVAQVDIVLEAKAEAERAAAYEDAQALMASGDYGAAVAAFAALGEYQDSAARLAEATEAAFTRAEALLDDGDTAAAEALFAAMGPGIDSDRALFLRQSSALKNAAPGQTVQYGAYEQDNDTGNGPEEIDWIVLAVEDGRAMLVSSRALDVRPYHDLQSQINWEGSTLRAWLNGDFLNTAFSAYHQGRIADTQVLDYKTVGTDEDRSTEDKVFLLHPLEVAALLGSDGKAACEVTAYCAAAAGDADASVWQLRAGAAPSAYASIAGHENAFSNRPVDVPAGIRPAVWVALTDDAGSAAPGSAPSQMTVPGAGVPGPDDILGSGEAVAYPNDDAWLERVWLKCVNVPNRAYLRLAPVSGADFDGYVYDGEVVTTFARQDNYTLALTKDGRFGWITSSLLKNDHP